MGKLCLIYIAPVGTGSCKGYHISQGLGMIIINLMESDSDNSIVHGGGGGDL
jgi:hypothetical protein